MSTSDTVVLLASGASGASPDPEAFVAGVEAVCAQLAQQLVADAEGASHDIGITVMGATSEAAAVAVGRAVARSALFKAAIYGNDPNWGRVLAQVGTVPDDVAPYDPDELDVTINGVQVCKGGAAHEPRSLVDLRANRLVTVLIDLHAGDEVATVWTNDLTHDYVTENSEYST
jgi:glutamate N-acetyltransferase/amino-acid N-acetyltransferase